MPYNFRLLAYAAIGFAAGLIFPQLGNLRTGLIGLALVISLVVLTEGQTE